MKTVSLRSKLGAHAAIAALLSGTMLTPPAVGQEALPTGGQVVSGSATIQTNGPSMTVNQSTDRMIANWQSFSIGAENSVTFNQPNAQSVALNRVIGQDPSRILGSLNANGQVFLLNPNGIVIGKNGQVQTGGLVGSTLGMSNADFLNGNYRFTGTGGSIVNQGDLKGGVVALIAPRVTNEGTITGNTALAAGTDVTLDFDGDGLLSVEVSASSLATLVENQGLIQADGGVAILTAKGANEALKGVVNNTGTVEAASLANRDGRILLLGDMDNGEVNAAGTLQASFVETSATQVNIADGLQVKTGGGTWLIDPTDFIIAASGGDMTGTTLSNNLANGNVEITTLAQCCDSDIYVNDSITWSSHTLTLDADRNITINAPLYGSGTAGLVLEYAQRNTIGDYYVNAPVNLASTGNFTTWNYNLVTHYTIITSLGTESSSGDGTLQGMRGDVLGNYVLGADIDAADTASWNSGSGFSPVGANGFGGTIDGLGHKITSLTINRPQSDNVGLISTTLNGSSGSVSIRNISLLSSDVTGKSRVGALLGNVSESHPVQIRNVYVSGSINGSPSGGNVGALAGFIGIGSNVINSHSDADVSGYNSVGGLVGWSRGNIVQSSSIGTVSGFANVGGLVGWLSGDGIEADAPRVENSFSGSSVIGTEVVGGLIGLSESGVQNSYAYGHVQGNAYVGGLIGIEENEHVLTNANQSNFWDSQSTGQSTGCGFVTTTCAAGGLATAQMKDSANFIAAGWDFDSIWAIDPAINNGYPYLRATVTETVTAPPPPPPPTVVLAVNDFGTSFSTSDAPYQPTIALTGTGFSDVTEVRFTWTDPNGQTGTVIWDASNSFGGGRFVVGSDTSATIAPVLVAAGDPSGTYQWTVTFVAGAQSITKNFAVSYAGVVTPPPPPPPPPPVPLSLTGTDAEIYSTDATPYRPSISLVGQGLNSVTSITLSWTGPGSDSGSTTWSGGSEFGDGRFEPSASGDTAILRPRVLVSSDAPGTYLWTVTLTNGSETVTRKFTVFYSAAQLESPLVQGVVRPPIWTSGEAAQRLQWEISHSYIDHSQAHLYSQDQLDFIEGYLNKCGSCATFGAFPLTYEVILHWGRNELDKAANEWMTRYATEDEFLEAGRAAGWFEPKGGQPALITIAPEEDEAFHQNEYEEVHKYVSTTGEEWVFDAYTRQLISSDADKGTFNLTPNSESQAGHTRDDILPWYLYGSGPNDVTDRDERWDIIVKAGLDKYLPGYGPN